mgnify:CR=1 FL=1
MSPVDSPLQLTIQAASCLSQLKSAANKWKQTPVTCNHNAEAPRSCGIGHKRDSACRGVWTSKVEWTCGPVVEVLLLKPQRPPVRGMVNLIWTNHSAQSHPSHCFLALPWSLWTLQRGRVVLPQLVQARRQASLLTPSCPRFGQTCGQGCCEPRPRPQRWGRSETRFSCPLA